MGGKVASCGESLFFPSSRLRSTVSVGLGELSPGSVSSPGADMGGPVRRVPGLAAGRVAPLLSRRCRIPGITGVIMGAVCAKTTIMVAG
jgi:hypothetical protein